MFRDCLMSIAVTAVCFPLETIQLHMRLGLADSVSDSVQAIWTQHGFSGFYIGIGPSLLKIVPYYILLHCGRLTCRGALRWWEIE